MASWLSPHSSRSSSYSDAARLSVSSQSDTHSAAFLQTINLLKFELQIETQLKLYDDISLEDFLQHVWGLSAEKQKQLLKLESIKKLDSTALAEYMRIVATKELKETSLHKPFTMISETLLQDILDELGELGKDTDNMSLYTWDGNGSTIIKSQFTHSKPGLIAVRWFPRAFKPDWPRTFCVLKFKSKHIPNTPLEDGSCDLLPAYIAGPDDPFTSSPSSSRARKVSVEAPFDVTDAIATGEKRKRSAKDVDGNDAKKQKHRTLTSLTHNQLQLATYALECMAVSSRYYITGILIEGFVITLWYYDCTAIVRTQSFDLIAFPQYLGLILYAMSQATVQQAGFDPHLYVLSTPSIEKAPGDAVVEKPFDIAVLTRLSSPVDELKNIYMKLSSKIADHQPPAVFKLVGHPLHVYRGLLGRGTMVYPVSQLINNKEWLNDLILKSSWQTQMCTPEGDIIQHLRKTIPAFKDHLPDIKYSAAYSSKDDLKLPRTQMPELKATHEHNGIEERDLYILSMPIYKKLWEVESIAEFKRVFIDCVECHYHAYKDGKVLHRDLSESNLMVWYTESGSVKGILNDWDMASELDTDGETPPSAALRRTGTIPFMACDLLNVKLSVHRYRHDLESFFYILVWAATHYNIEKRIREANTKRPLIYWMQKDMVQACVRKSNFIIFYSKAEIVFEHILSEFKDVLTDWIVPLRSLFRDAFLSADDAYRKNDTSYDFSTCGGLITFETFMRTMGMTPRYVPPLSIPAVN
ncbi:hypothetical protein BDQ12DRAFT_681704 [Crucibulum laeve]|uniref:Fungal-type protein kinase domain-containing protein n=1 Tax=Crucibulum laeve TaxID=68775 RepID=A0A5C3M2B6_9AGAR|nr:hypothetical protein BDQ12DRAFT_681704 [Crucibulum laeve]